MSRIHSELGKLRDIAIEYLPEAKQFREQAKSFRLDEDDCGNPYAEGLWRIADEISTRPAATEQERAAARLLLAFIGWELYEPSCPGLGYTAAHNEDACVALVPGIINIAKQLAEVTGRAISFMRQDVSAEIDWKQYLQDGRLPIEEKAYVIDDGKAYRGHLTRLADARTGCTISDLLRKAENREILLFASLRSFSAVTTNTAGEKHPVISRRQAHGDDVELLPMYARDIERFGQAELSHFPAELPDMGDRSLWYWRLDTPQTITADNLFIADGHVRVSPQAAAPSGAPEEVKPVTWIIKAQEIAQRIGTERWRVGQRQITSRNVAGAVTIELAKDTSTHGLQGQRGEDNVRSIGLKGWVFTPPI